jgi:hypothetical protein
MPCYAVAAAQAQVSQEHLLGYLTPDKIQEPLTAYLQARFPEAAVEAGPGPNTAHWTIRQASWVLTLDITGGQVTARDYGRDQSAATALAEEIAPVLVQIGAAYWQQDVLALLGQYALGQPQSTPDGAVVIRLQV